MRAPLRPPDRGQSKLWYERDGGKRLAQDRAAITTAYAGLEYWTDPGDGHLELRGDLSFAHDCGIITRIAVRLVFPDRYPDAEPLAYDAAGRFPIGLERHLLKGGRCCLWLPPRSRWHKYDPAGLRAFLDEVTVFFHRQLIYDATGRKRWPGGEYPHGYAGYRSYLGEVLNVDDTGLEGLRPVLLGVQQVERNDKCPCGSKRRFKRCHSAPVFNVQHDLGKPLITAIFGSGGSGGCKTDPCSSKGTA